MLKAGHGRFMGHGDSWGFIFTHKSTLGFMGIHNIFVLFMNPHESLIPKLRILTVD